MAWSSLGVVAHAPAQSGVGSVAMSTVVGVILALAIFALYYRFVLKASGQN